MIGTLGDVVFEVSSQKVLTFQSIQRNAKARYQRHNVISTKPVLEFVGDDLDEIPLSIRLDATKGINVLAEITRLRDHKTNGERLTLIIGGNVLGDFIIESVNDTWERIIKGEPLIARVNLSLIESVIE